MENANTKPQREIVTPGLVISTDASMEAGRGSIKTGGEIISLFVGLKEIRGKYVNVVPLNGLYNPQVGDKVIGRIIDQTPVKWLVDINSKFIGTLRPKDAVRQSRSNRGYGRNKSKGSYQFKEESDMSLFKVGDLVICKIMSGDRLEEPELTTLGPDLGPIRNGIIVKISPPKIPRVIGKKGSMISLLKDLLNCRIFVAQNGRIWIHGKNPDRERLLMDAIEKIEIEAHTVGLTDRIKNYVIDEKTKRGLN